MNEIAAIVAAQARAVREERPSALATVVRTHGSAYRRPGARLLVTADGCMTGNLSPGCLENDVAEHARAVMKAAKPRLLRYDTGAKGGVVWGLGLGCGGIIEVLVEPLPADAKPAHLALLGDCAARGRPGVIATLFDARSAAAGVAKPGARLALDADGRVRSEFEPFRLQQAAKRDALAVLRSGMSRVKTYEWRGGEVSALIEYIAPPLRLVIFGAQPDAAETAVRAGALGWQVTVVDTQAREASRERFAAADELMLCRPAEVADRVRLTPRTMALLMTHRYLDDMTLCEFLLASPAAYIGMLGPKHRSERIIGAAGRQVDRERLHAPAGLDIGAETPAEIALSLVAEIRAVAARRGGGFLRDRAGPIHASAASETAGDVQASSPASVEELVA